MKPALLLCLLTLPACGATEPPSCRGEVFPLNPTRMTPNLAAVAPIPVSGSVVR